MKSFCRLAVIAFVALQISACGEKPTQSSNSGTTALAPETSLQSCLPPAQGQQFGIQSNPYQSPYQNASYSPYPWNTYNQNQAAFCGCPQGTIPACQPGSGLYCVQVQNPYQTSWYSYNNVNNNYSPYAGYNVRTGYNPYASNSCGSQVGRLCQVGVLGTCGNFGSCVAGYANSPYGICNN